MDLHPKGTKISDPVPLSEAIKALLEKPAFWLTAGATIAAFTVMGSPFQSIFLVRTHGIDGRGIIWINTPVALSAAIGTFVTGWLATRL